MTEYIDLIDDKKNDEFLFDTLSSSPSRIENEALKATLSGCLHSTRKPLIYVAPIPCGGGKSRTVQEFIAEWKSDGFLGNGSAIIMLPTLDEVDTYIAGCQLTCLDYACLSPRKEYAAYGLGRGRADQARALFVTHEQMRRRVTATGSFEAITEFHYDGKPRTLRICDEGLLPAVPVSIRLSTVEGLPEAIVQKNAALALMIEDLRLDKAYRVEGHELHIPLELQKDAFKLAYGGKDWLSSEQVKALEGLAYLSGRSASLRQDNRFKGVGGLHIVGSSSPLPNDLAPCIIMDASANLRHFYKDWASRTSNVAFLPAPQVSYRDLELRWWNVGASKSNLGDRSTREKIIGVVASTINAKPSERWLVIHSKSVSGCSIIDELERDLKQNNAEFLHWGLHLGKNEYREIRNVIILGALHYGQIGFAAHHHAATGGVGDQSNAAINLSTDGEFAHNIYQATCRSNLRNISFGFAGEATVYLITPHSLRKQQGLKQAFPDATITDWQPIPPKPKKPEQRFMQVVTSLFQSGKTIIRTKEILQGCGAKDSKYIQPLWKKKTIMEFLDQQGLVRKGHKLFKVLGAS